LAGRHRNPSTLLIFDELIADRTDYSFAKVHVQQVLFSLSEKVSNMEQKK